MTCILALANMGSSFAAAILSKDVKSTQGALVDKASGKTLKTDSWTNIVTEDKDATEERRRRKMQECQTETDEGESDEHLSCVFHDHLISKADGLSLLAECMSGGDVDIHFKHEEHEIAHLESHCICGEGHDAVYDLDENNVPISATITAGDHTYIVQPDTEQPDIYYDVVLDTPIPGN